MSNRKVPADPYARAQYQELVRVVRSLAPRNTWYMDRLFEDMVCSCHAQREELARLNREKQERLQESTDWINREYVVRIARLEAEIREIDSREHPEIHRISRRASKFFPLWMLERLRLGQLDLVNRDQQDLQQEFARDWLNGWHPLLPKAELSTKARRE
jgi:hypothetical protein